MSEVGACLHKYNEPNTNFPPKHATSRAKMVENGFGASVRRHIRQVMTLPHCIIRDKGEEMTLQGDTVLVFCAVTLPRSQATFVGGCIVHEELTTLGAFSLYLML